MNDPRTGLTNAGRGTEGRGPAVSHVPAAGTEGGEVTAFWDAEAARYDRAYESRGRGGRVLRSRQEAVLGLLGEEPGEVLDVGMGAGRLLLALSARGWRVSGVDASERMVELARRRLPHAAARLRQASLEGLPFADASFDAVVATGVLEYAGYGERALSELGRVVRPGGLAVVSVPNAWSLPRVWRRTAAYPLARSVKRVVPFGRPAPLRRRPPPGRPRLRRLLGAAGLAIESARYTSVVVPLEALFPRAAARLAARLERGGSRVTRLLAGQVVCRARKPHSGNADGVADVGAAGASLAAAPSAGRCAACRSAERSFLYRWEGGLQVWRCSVCGLLYTDPLPDDDYLARYYGSLTSTEGEPGHMRRRDQPEARLAAVTDALSAYLRVANEIRGTDAPGRLLDAGGGVGLYSKAAELLGWEAHCIEIDAGAVEFARSRLGLKHAIRGDVNSLREHVDGSFDLVLCRHVIEHVPDPASLIGQLASVAAPGGVVVVETPNAHNREQWAHPGILPIHWRVLGRENPALSALRRLRLTLSKPLSAANPPKHLYGFTPQSLDLLLRRCGLEPRKQVAAACGDPVFDPLYYLGDSVGRWSPARAAYRLYERRASKLVSLVGKESMLAVFARRLATAGPEGKREPGGGSV